MYALKNIQITWYIYNNYCKHMKLKRCFYTMIFNVQYLARQWNSWKEFFNFLLFVEVMCFKFMIRHDIVLKDSFCSSLTILLKLIHCVRRKEKKWTTKSLSRLAFVWCHLIQFHVWIPSICWKWKFQLLYF